MAEQPSELKKLAAIATDMELTSAMRTKAVETIGKMGTHEALLALLTMAGNEDLIRQERELALKQAMQIVKSTK